MEPPKKKRSINQSISRSEVIPAAQAENLYKFESEVFRGRTRVNLPHPEDPETSARILAKIEREHSKARAERVRKARS